MEMDKELIDKLLGDYQKPEDLIGENLLATALLTMWPTRCKIV